MTLKAYRFSHRYKKNIGCSTESLDPEVLKEIKERMDKKPDMVTSEIRESSKDGFLYCDLSCEMLTVEFVVGRAIKIGDRHMDARCSGMRSFYTMPEFENEARLQFEKECKAQKELADGYYSQPWV